MPRTYDKKNKEMLYIYDENKQRVDLNPKAKWPEWITTLIHEAATGRSTTQIAKDINKCRSWAIRVVNFPAAKKAIKKIVDDRCKEYEKRVFNLADKAITEMENLIVNGKDEKVKLDACKTVLEKFRLVGDDVKDLPFGGNNSAVQINVNFVGKDDDNGKHTRSVQGIVTGTE